MKNKLLSRFAAIAALCVAFGMTACDDDNDDPSPAKIEINHQEQWLGAACECVGDNCEMFGIPLPQGTPLSGCNNVPVGLPGTQAVCLRTIPEEAKITAPPVWFPQGYCTLSAVACEPASEFTCQMASYGNVDEFKSCPHGSAMLASDFDYEIMGIASELRTRTCAKLCETDADCNDAGEVSCVERSGIKFCYNEKNFKYTGEPVVTAF